MVEILFVDEDRLVETVRDLKTAILQFTPVVTYCASYIQRLISWWSTNRRVNMSMPRRDTKTVRLPSNWSRNIPKWPASGAFSVRASCIG